MTETIQKPALESAQRPSRQAVPHNESGQLIMLQPDQINPAVDLPKTMKAIVAYAPGDYRLEEVEGAPRRPRRHHHRG